MAKDTNKIHFLKTPIQKLLKLGGARYFFSRLIHDVNNSMTIISGSFQLIDRLVAKEEINREKIKKMANEGLVAAKKIQEINDSYLCYLDELGEKGPSNLKEIVEAKRSEFDKKLERLGFILDDLNLSDSEISIPELAIVLDLYTYLFFCWICEEATHSEENKLNFSLENGSFSILVSFEECGNKFKNLFDQNNDDVFIAPFFQIYTTYLEECGFHCETKGDGNQLEICLNKIDQHNKEAA